MHAADRLVAEGASAGGMMVGRAMTERPDLFAGVHLAFGLLNPMRAESHPNGAPNIAEFGRRLHGQRPPGPNRHRCRRHRSFHNRALLDISVTQQDSRVQIVDVPNRGTSTYAAVDVYQYLWILCVVDDQSTMNKVAPVRVRERCGSAPSAT
jgi:hypothetical protein